MAVFVRRPVLCYIENLFLCTLPSTHIGLHTYETCAPLDSKVVGIRADGITALLIVIVCKGSSSNFDYVPSAKHVKENNVF